MSTIFKMYELENAVAKETRFFHLYKKKFINEKHSYFRAIVDMLWIIFSVCIGYGVIFLLKDVISSFIQSTDRPWALQAIAILLLLVIPLVIGFVTFQQRTARFYQMKSTEFFDFRMKLGIHAIEVWIVKHKLTQNKWNNSYYLLLNKKFRIKKCIR